MQDLLIVTWDTYGPVVRRAGDGAHGRFDQQARTWSPQFWATTHRGWLALAGAGVAAAIGTVVARRNA